MGTDIDSLHKDLMDIKKDLDIIKNILSENYELSDFAKKELLIARETPESEYSDLE